MSHLPKPPLLGISNQDQIYRPRRPRKRSCDSMTDNSGCALFKPARPLSGLWLRSLSIRLSAAATRSRARSKSAIVYRRGSGRARIFPRSILQLSGEHNGLDLVPSRHRASDYLNPCPDVFGLFFVARLAAGAIT
jgi:hypothetical protein